MKITPRHFADALVLKVEGRLDHDTTRDFQDAYAAVTRSLKREVRGVVLDLAGLDYVSSSGLKALLQAAREAKANERRVMAAGLQPMIAEIFATAHLALVIQVFPTVRDAVAAISVEAAAAMDATAAKPG